MRREPRVIGASLSIVASSSSISTAARTLSRVRQPAGRVAVVQCCASIHHRQALTHLSSWLHIKEEEAARSTFFWFGSYSKAIPSTPSSPIHILSQSPSLSLSLLPFPCRCSHCFFLRSVFTYCRHHGNVASIANGITEREFRESPSGHVEFSRFTRNVV